MTWFKKLFTNRQRKQKRTSNRYKGCTNLYRSTISLSVVALAANTPVRTNNVQFNTDSAPVGINNRCTGCILYVPEDIVGDLQDSSKSIK